MFLRICSLLYAQGMISKARLAASQIQMANGNESMWCKDITKAVLSFSATIWPENLLASDESKPNSNPLIHTLVSCSYLIG